MVYRAIGLMSGSSMDGLDIAFVELDDSGGTWQYEVRASSCVPYSNEWVGKLKQAPALGAYAYLQLHAEYGRYLGQQVNSFIDEHHLHHQVQLVASHGHTAFHAPGDGFTAQLGDGAAIAAVTGINVVSDLRSMDVALGGQGAPIVPVGEMLLWKGFDYFANFGGIANISARQAEVFTAFDVCPANSVLNTLAQLKGLLYDDNGSLARNGTIHQPLLHALNGLPYYAAPYPKSLANTFGSGVVYPLVQSYALPVQDALCTYVEHIAQQVSAAVGLATQGTEQPVAGGLPKKMLVTGGGAFNGYLMGRLAEYLAPLGVGIEIPAAETVQYKEAIVMALLGVLRWREENTVLASVTGASRNSIGGAVWIGQEA